MGWIIFDRQLSVFYFKHYILYFTMHLVIVISMEILLLFTNRIFRYRYF